MFADVTWHQSYGIRSWDVGGTEVEGLGVWGHWRGASGGGGGRRAAAVAVGGGGRPAVVFAVNELKRIGEEGVTGGFTCAAAASFATSCKKKREKMFC